MLDLILEITGLVTGLLCVWLLIRQNILTFPIGLAYSVVSIFVNLNERLYAAVLLSGYYVIMNAYGWWYWRRALVTTGDELPVTHTPWPMALLLGAIVIVGVTVLNSLLTEQTNANLALLDSSITVLSFVAMWMAARKYLENWWLWLVVNILSTAMYTLTGTYPYAVLYLVYIGMAVWGFMEWRSSFRQLA